MLTAKDIEFLARKTKLNPSKAQSLFEEKEDGDLVLEELSKKRITKKEVLELSFPIFIKLLVNREMKGVDQKYKNYISDFTSVFYPRIMGASRIKTKIPRKLNEESAQYFFVLACFFEDDLSAQLDIKQIHQMLKYTMDSFVKFKGKDCVEAISESFDYFNIIKKKWMKG
tara:strand:- start:451 stop:960 length:510 start_codon:yes stop_codon:yes gene_type:complete